MKKEELENEMLGYVVCSLGNLQFAIYMVDVSQLD